MEVKIKETGEIITVSPCIEIGPFGQCFSEVEDMNGVIYSVSDIEIIPQNKESEEDNQELESDPGYWERLKHQAAISAMQAILSNPDITASVDANTILSEYVVGNAVYYATALVEKLKNE